MKLDPLSWRTACRTVHIYMRKPNGIERLVILARTAVPKMAPWDSWSCRRSKGHPEHVAPAKGSPVATANARTTDSCRRDCKAGKPAIRAIHARALSGPVAKPCLLMRVASQSGRAPGGGSCGSPGVPEGAKRNMGCCMCTCGLDVAMAS